MIKTNLLRYGAIGVATLGFVGVAAASTASITGPTGPHSHNSVTVNNGMNVKVTNRNTTGVLNFNAQGASTGDVSAKENTTVDDLSSGSASNSNSTATDVTIDNSGSSSCGCTGFGSGDNDASITGPTGPNSTNTVKINNDNKLTISNTNKTDVYNVNLQWAQSGDVKANDNTTVGGLSSGDASNDNTTTTSVSVTN
jgi:hypothetical protein